MTLSHQLERQLPLLRRYARAALRDSELADECVADAIKVLISEFDNREGLERALDLEMYRLIEQAIQNRTTDSHHQAAWRAVVLVQLEHLTIEETARVLGMSTDWVKKIVSLL